MKSGFKNLFKILQPSQHKHPFAHGWAMGVLKAATEGFSKRHYNVMVAKQGGSMNRLQMVNAYVTTHEVRSRNGVRKKQVPVRVYTYMPHGKVYDRRGKR